MPPVDQRSGRAHEPNHQGGHLRAYHYETHDQLREHLSIFVAAYNFAKRLKSLGGKTPFEAIVDAWTKQPKRFRLSPNHLTSGLNI